jgi:hypothetical protein
MAKNKTIQRAIMCLYLRKRHARKHRDRFITRLNGKALSKFDELNLATLRAAENEAHNALESLKRVLCY